MGKAREVKVFQVSVEEDPEPLIFTLEFEKEDGDKEAHTFSAHSVVGAAESLALGSMVRFNEKGEQLVDLNGITTYFNHVLMNDDYDKLKSLIDRDDLRISMDTLGDVFNWLLEEQTGRPTKASSSSSDGRRTTGQRSTGSRSSVG